MKLLANKPEKRLEKQYSPDIVSSERQQGLMTLVKNTTVMLVADILPKVS